MLQITHHDLDGLAAVKILRLLHPKCPYVICGNPRALDEMLLKQCIVSDEVWITDLAPTSREVLEKFIENSKIGKIYIVDHHPESKWIHGIDIPNVYGYHDEKYSGTENLFNYLRKTDLVLDNTWFNYVPPFIQCVTAYDLWQLNSSWRQLGEKLHHLLHFFGRDFLIETPFKDLTDKYSDVHKAIISKMDGYIKKMLDRVFISNLQIFDQKIKVSKTDSELTEKIKLELALVEDKYNKATFALVLAEKHASQIGNELLKKFPQIDFSVIINPLYDGISFRSRKNGFNVSHLARKFGGGGHKSASGCPLAGKGMYFMEVYLKHKYPEFNFQITKYSGKE